jgi:hypothetical protein
MGKVHEQNINCRLRYIPGDETVQSPTDKNGSYFDSTGRVSCGGNTEVLCKVQLSATTQQGHLYFSPTHF